MTMNTEENRSNSNAINGKEPANDVGATVDLTGGIGGDTLSATSVEDDRFDPVDQADGPGGDVMMDLTGGIGGDTLSATSVEDDRFDPVDQAAGPGGDATFERIGGAGADTLYGNRFEDDRFDPADDIAGINGGAGNDVLFSAGDAGGDQLGREEKSGALTGGAGSDTFGFADLASDRFGSANQAASLYGVYANDSLLASDDATFFGDDVLAIADAELQANTRGPADPDAGNTVDEAQPFGGWQMSPGADFDII